MVLGGGDPYLIVLDGGGPYSSVLDGGQPYSSVLDGGGHKLWYLVVGTHTLLVGAHTRVYSTDRAKVHTTYANLNSRTRITCERFVGVRITREGFLAARM